MAQQERAKAIVDVDGQQAGAELKKLQERAKELRSELSKLGQDNDLAGFRQKEKELKLVNSQMRNVKKSAWDMDAVLKNMNGRSLNELIRASRQLSSEIKSATRHTKEEIAAYDQKIAKLKQVNGQIAKVKAESHLAAQAQGSWLSKATTGFNKYFGIISAGVAAFTGVVFSVKSLIQGNVELDDSLANVRKTTGLTQKEVREFYSDLNNLNTRTPKKELLELAEEAGRLGISGKKDIMDFVEVANQIKVALGDDLGGNSAEAIKEVGKLTNVFKVGEKYGVDFRQSMLMVGSSINEVSASSAADAPFLIDMAKRMAGVSSQAGIAVQDIIGMAAALDEMGQTSEVSSTTLNKVIVNMFKDTGTYAELANMNLQDFTNLLNKDANEALMKVLQGLNGNNSGLSTMAQKLDGLGLDGARSVQTLAALAGNLDLVRKNQTLANDSLEKGTSLTNEYQIKNNNMAGSLEKIGRAIRGAFVSSGINEALTNIVTNVAKWVEIPVSRTMEDQRIKVNMLAIELTDANTQEQRRKDIYDELKAISPDIVNGLNLEALSVDQLRGNLAKYNDEAIKKIAIEKASEAKRETEKKYGDAIGVTLKKEEALRQSLMKIQRDAIKYDKEKAEQINNILLSTEDILDKESEIQKIVIDINKQQKINAINGTYAANAAFEVRDAKAEELELGKQNNKELAAYQEMYQNLTGHAEDFGKSGWFDFGPGEGSSSGELIIPEDPDADKNKTKIDKEVSTLAKLADKQAEFRMRIINESKSLIEQENIAYEQRLKDAGLFGQKKEEMTGEFLQTYEILESQHTENIKKIHDQAYSDDIIKNQKNFDQQTILRQTAHNNEMAALGNNEEAKKALEKKFQKEELERQQSFLLSLLAELKQTADQEGLTGIDEKLLSEEQKELLKNRIEEVKLMLSELGVKLSDLNSEEPQSVEKQKSNVDIFGMSSEDWESLVNHILDGEFALEDLMDTLGALTNMWSDFYAIKNNLDQQDMAKFEASTNSKKEILQKQLDNGIISQEAYNSQVALLDETLDAKRKEVALRAAKRERQIALMNAIVNTAAGIVKMLNNPWPLNLILAALVGVAGGLQIGKIVSTPLPQYAMGRYDVIGDQDGKKYNARVMDSPGTGLVNSPAILVGEKPEIIIDPHTTRNLQLNYPEVIEAINAARMPQYASGRYPSTKETITERPLPKEFYDIMDRQNAEISRLNDQLNKGIGAKLVTDGEYMKKHNEVAEDYQALKDQVSLRS